MPRPAPTKALLRPRGNDVKWIILMNLALFDLDNTLLNGDSDFEWSQFLIRIGVLDRELFEAKNLPSMNTTRPGPWISRSSLIFN